ncbi:unnamed protein product [Adineta ricciae]|uniref:Potassium channel domain-containing protein n=1 Tax=Adineta ricciae TaxID=249248 RepID=A0A815S4R1_ADIRI|nr:unnamed protein product [Adineta ricciae]
MLSGTTRIRTLLYVDEDDNNDVDDDEQFKTISGEVSHLRSSQVQRILAPLVAFDENGDIPLRERNSSSFVSARPVSSNSPVEYCCGLCLWNRLRQDFCRIFIQFLFSQLGLFVLVCMYIVLGGFLFYGIESKYELRKNEQIKIKHLHGIHKIRQIATDEFNWMLNASFELRYALWRGMISRSDEYDDYRWRVYVHSERFDRLIHNELARMQADEEKLSDKQDESSATSYDQKWTFSTAMLYSATVITTVGYGNITPKSMLGKMFTCLYAMLGIPITIMYLTNTSDLLVFLFVKYYSMMYNFFHRLIKRFRRWRRSHQRRRSVEIDDEAAAAEHRVPIWIAFSVLVLYLIAGALLFSHWEGWSYVDGAYFSFITFTTIGLGDLVPGKGTLTENKNGKSVLCALYLLFGLALTAMCFKLMQDDIFELRQRIYSKLGFSMYRNQYVYHNRRQHMQARASST